jgi:hypothetical protein
MGNRTAPNHAVLTGDHQQLACRHANAAIQQARWAFQEQRFSPRESAVPCRGPRLAVTSRDVVYEHEYRRNRQRMPRQERLPPSPCVGSTRAVWPGQALRNAVDEAVDRWK